MGLDEYTGNAASANVHVQQSSFSIDIPQSSLVLAPDTISSMETIILSQVLVVQQSTFLSDMAQGSVALAPDTISSMETIILSQVLNVQHSSFLLDMNRGSLVLAPGIISSMEIMTLSRAGSPCTTTLGQTKCTFRRLTNQRRASF